MVQSGTVLIACSNFHQTKVDFHRTFCHLLALVTMLKPDPSDLE